MMCRLAFAVLIGLSAIPAQADTSPLASMGMRDQLLGWEAVGRVDTGVGFCTGTLIATDLVLTAAHCLYDPAKPGTLADVSQFTFRAGFRNGEALAERRVMRAFGHPAYIHAPEVTAEAIRHDIAILQLDQPIPAGTASPFLVETLPANDAQIAVVSYAAGRSEALSIQRRCDVTARGGGLYQFNCDVAPGSSGAPVFDMSEGRARIVSVVSSGYDSGNGVVSYGMDVESLLDDVKRELRGAGPVQSASAPVILKQGETRAGGARFLKAP